MGWMWTARERKGSGVHWLGPDGGEAGVATFSLSSASMIPQEICIWCPDPWGFFRIKSVRGLFFRALAVMRWS